MLWFDEYYDEARYRWQSSVQAADATDVLLVVGTSGATNLPLTMAQQALNSGARIVDINPQHNVFSTLAERSGGVHMAGAAGEHLPGLVAAAIDADT